MKSPSPQDADVVVSVVQNQCEHILLSSSDGLTTEIIYSTITCAITPPLWSQRRHFDAELHLLDLI